MTDTNVDAGLEEQGKNDAETEGKLDTDANNTQENQDNKEEKRLTQSEVNEVVKRAKLDAERAAKTKLEKSLEGKHVLTDDELSAKLKEAVDAALKEQSLIAIRKTIQDEYGLNDYQVSKLEGSSEKELKEDAEKTYGKRKKDAPILNGGADINNDKQQSSILAQQQQQRVNELKKKYHIK